MSPLVVTDVQIYFQRINSIGDLKIDLKTPFVPITKVWWKIGSSARGLTASS